MKAYHNLRQTKTVT